MAHCILSVAGGTLRANSDHEELRRLYDRDPATFLERTGDDPATELLLLKLGAAVTEQKDELALELAMRALRELPERAESHLWSAILYRRLNHPLAAMESIDCAEAVAATPDLGHWARQLRGAVLRSLGRQKDAAVVYDALRAEQNLSTGRRVRVLINAASAYWPLGRLADADACLDEAAAVADWPVRENTEAWRHAIRAWVCAARGDLEALNESVRSALAATGGEALAAHRSARRAQARGREEAGDFPAAEAELLSLAAEARREGWTGELADVLEDLATLRRKAGDGAGELVVQRERIVLLKTSHQRERAQLARLEAARLDAARLHRGDGPDKPN
ncbi:MAG: hypothetical protein AAF447_14230 [Myxococcota bacterium]